MVVAVEIWVIALSGLAVLAAGRASSLIVPSQWEKIHFHKTQKKRFVAGRDLGGIYRDLIIFLEKEKPYLKSDFRVGDAARELYTNRNYVAMAVKNFDGGNFCTLVNKYRIKHSIDLFMKNPSLRVGEMAALSGFNSPAAYTMAFKLYMNIPPGEWCRRYIDEGYVQKPRRPSKV